MRLAHLVAVALAASVTAAAQQPPPRDPPAPGGVRRAVTLTDEVELKRKLAAEPSNPAHYVALATALERRGAAAEAEATWMAARTSVPTADVIRQIAGFYNRQGQFDRTIAMLEEVAALTPNDAAGYHLIGTYYQEKIQKDNKLAHQDRWTYTLQGIAAEDRALALKPDYVEALVYKNILLRQQANLEADPGQRKLLLAEADALRNRAIELQRQGQSPAERGVRVGPQPPPPPQQGGCHREMPDGQVPVRVGGNIKAPTKTSDARPVYPPEAQSARVQGVVILELVVTTTGQVFSPCVLRSIPMLDQAAIDAVSQWQFEPTMLNGMAVPVIMTVTVNFTLQEQASSQKVQSSQG